MTPWDWTFSIALVIVAGVVGGFSGFGSAMILMPSLSLLLAPPQLVAIALLVLLL